MMPVLWWARGRLSCGLMLLLELSAPSNAGMSVCGLLGQAASWRLEAQS